MCFNHFHRAVVRCVKSRPAGRETTTSSQLSARNHNNVMHIPNGRKLRGSAPLTVDGPAKSCTTKRMVESVKIMGCLPSIGAGLFPSTVCHYQPTSWLTVFCSQDLLQIVCKSFAGNVRGFLGIKMFFLLKKHLWYIGQLITETNFYNRLFRLMFGSLTFVWKWDILKHQGLSLFSLSIGPLPFSTAAPEPRKSTFSKSTHVATIWVAYS